jgi:hypothetical protein
MKTEPEPKKITPKNLRRLDATALAAVRGAKGNDDCSMSQDAGSTAVTAATP